MISSLFFCLSPNGDEITKFLLHAASALRSRLSSAEIYCLSNDNGQGLKRLTRRNLICNKYSIIG